MKRSLLRVLVAPVVGIFGLAFLVYLLVIFRGVWGLLTSFPGKLAEGLETPEDRLFFLILFLILYVPAVMYFQGQKNTYYESRIAGAPRDEEMERHNPWLIGLIVPGFLIGFLFLTTLVA